MRLVLQPRIDRVRELRPAPGGIDGIEFINRAHACDVGKSVIADTEQRQGVIALLENLTAVQLDLLAMFQPIEETVSIGNFHRDP